MKDKEYSDTLKFNHVVLDKISNDNYKVMKDITGNISAGSMVSERVVNFYRTTYPAMRIAVVE